ncbi:MAG: ROK family protein [Acidobacteriaceae bacterium]|nr:ROK family protein [Acidobacteriaceae bacterium]MBV9780905.1 ROK family protein [Acidobacteriaceae bacterium]
MFGGIEAGGTKFVCGIGTGPDDLHVAQFPTTVPELTIPKVIAFFKEEATDGFDALGIGSFGPVDLDPNSPSFGHITSTPKPGWQNYYLAGVLGGALGVPVGFDTDVNAALLAEARWGAARGLPDFVYLTIGTGVGGGAMVNGKLVHGLVHTEMGHLRIPHDLARDPYPGLCPYHGDCLEGLACGPAMQARWGVPGIELPPAHPAWALEAEYLALAVLNLTMTLSPRRILLGGGVMQQPRLFGLMREEFARLLNGYIQHRELSDHLDKYLMPPQLGGRSGVLGALILGEQALAGSARQAQLRVKSV